MSERSKLVVLIFTPLGQVRNGSPSKLGVTRVRISKNLRRLNMSRTRGGLFVLQYPGRLQMQHGPISYRYPGRTLGCEGKLKKAETSSSQCTVRAATARQDLGSSVHKSFGGTVGDIIRSDGLAATLYMIMKASDPGCEDTWTDPMSDLIELTRQISFRASLQYATFNRTNQQQVQFDSTSKILIYVTDSRKMWLAVGVSITGMLTVLPLFWKWWELGRDVSFNPLEIANAFQPVEGGTHIMEGIDPNQNVKGITRAVKNLEDVRYGAWETSGGVIRLGFAEARAVREPFRGERFNY